MICWHFVASWSKQTMTMEREIHCRERALPWNKALCFHSQISLRGVELIMYSAIEAGMMQGLHLILLWFFITVKFTCTYNLDVLVQSWIAPCQNIVLFCFSFNSPCNCISKQAEYRRIKPREAIDHKRNSEKLLFEQMVCSHYCSLDLYHPQPPNSSTYIIGST